MADYEGSAKRTKYDFTKSATIILSININQLTEESSRTLNQLIHSIGIDNLEYDPNITDDKPFQISMIFKDKAVRDEIIKKYNNNPQHQFIMSTNFETNGHTILTQCNNDNIIPLIAKMIHLKGIIESYYISKPIEGKFYIKINGKNDTAVTTLLQQIPESRIYKTREMLALENELNVSMPLNPSIYNEETAHTVAKTICNIANIPFNNNSSKITRKSKSIQHSNGETSIVQSMRIHYTAKDINERDAILATKTLVKTQKRRYFRGMTSNAQFFRNLPNNPRPIYSPSNYNTNTTIPDQDNTRITNIETRLDKIEESVTNLGCTVTELGVEMRTFMNRINQIFAGTGQEEEEQDGEDEEMENDNNN